MPDPDWAALYLREYRAITGGLRGDIYATVKALRSGMDGDYFSQRKSKLDRRMKAALGLAASAYGIDDGGSRPRRYALRLAPDAVRFAADAPLQAKAP